MVLQNIRYAFRVLRKSPGFAAVAVLTLALGIGANTAVFSVVDAVMLRPLPYTDPERLVALWEKDDRGLGSRSNVAPANLVDYVRATPAFDGLAGYASTSMSLTKAGEPDQLLGEAITWNLFAVLGVAPAVGRPFVAAEDRPGRERVVILTDALWRGRFAGDPSILGRSITLNGEPYEVVGVMPAGFQPLTQFGVPVPVTFFVPAAYPDELLANHGDHEIRVVGRLKPGVTLEQARADLHNVSSDLARRFPRTNATVRAQIAPLRDDIVRDVRASLLVMLGAVGLVLLVACVNLANLLIVRAIGQRHECAIRLALGASRWQIAAEILTRAVVLAVLGGAAGLLCGVWTRDVLAALAPPATPRLDHLAVSARVLAVTAVSSLLAALFAALLPALHTSRGDAAALKTSELAISGARSVMRWRGLLMAGEIAAALVVAVGAGLLVRSLVRLNAVDLGFETERVLTVNIRLPETRYKDQRARAAFFDEVARRVRGIPGVQRVAFANQFPMRGGWGSSVRMTGPAGEVRDNADFQAVSPGYFATLGIPLLRGRLIGSEDRDGSPHVAVVSRTFVQRFLTGRDPIGQQFSRTAPGAPVVTIVGVVGEVRRDGKQAELAPQVYLPAAQTDVYPVRLGALAVRTSGDPHALVASLQRAVWSVDPDQPITGVRTLDEVLSASLAQRRFNMMLLTSFASLALYGVVAYAAAERTREIGLRIALGATERDVVALVVRGGLAWVLLGIAAGVGGAIAATRVMTGLLFGVTPTDPATFVSTVIIMAVVALAASYVPARRAASIDPIAALRME
jgi:putative ABC transport system permease protein